MYSITNFSNYPTLSASEVIGAGEIQSQMTSHGLGSGIYGFIDKSNSLTSFYHSYKCQKTIYMKNPYIIRTKEHLSNFSFFSTIFNNVVKELCENNVSDEQIIDYFESNGFEMSESQIISFDESNNKIMLFESFGFGKLLEKIKHFVSDYKLLMANPKDNFIIMPINYLLAGLHDGIYNLANDTANAGSVIYQYPKPRSFITNKKTIIFKGKNFSTEH